MRHLLKKFRTDTRGNVAIIFAFAAIPIVGVAGMAVDYTRAARVETILQSAADASALAGATQVDPSAVSGKVEAMMNASLPGGLSGFGATYALETDSATVTVTAESDVPTTISAIFRPNIPVAVAATAAFGEPMRIVDLSVTEFNANAWDANSIYWYIVPEDGGAPAPEDMFLLLSNDPNNPPPDEPQPITIGVNQQIGFALVNVTGGIRPYGNNSYGQPRGSSHTFYSHLEPENLRTEGTPDCASGTVEHAWDDNGGGSDDNDYNDAVYEFECTVIQTDPTSVVLIK